MLLVFLSTCLRINAASFSNLPLNDLSAFKPVSSNWRVAGSVLVHLSGDKLLSGTPGTGTLICIPTKEAREHLFTHFHHADIEFECDVMVPIKSNSGLYFQGRYEIQILDSWGQDPPRQGDMGGIYQRWDETKENPADRGYEGHPPRVNASRKPGEWQHFKISFRAPRFDALGNKTEKARFEEVWLNGQLLHESVELTGPTRSSAWEDEVPMGPLMIQGDHGPVAFRNLKIRHLDIPNPPSDRPQVLIIGDSISLGYTPVLMGMLKGKVDITRPLNSGGGWINCEGTKRGIEMIDEWLALKDRWDVIHFNFGLHDLKHVLPGTTRNSTDPSHPQQANLKEYDQNLRIIVSRLKATGAKLIFATTTPYPDKPGGPLRRADQPAKYNQVAHKIMKENGIRVNDLYGFTLPRMEELLLPNNVHFRPDANLELAEIVKGEIMAALN